MNRPNLNDPELRVGNEKNVAERLMASQKLSSPVYLHGEKPPTRNQVAAVLHTLADHSLNTMMVGPDVRKIGENREHLGTRWAQASGLGRLLQMMGDALETVPVPDDVSVLVEELREARNFIRTETGHSATVVHLDAVIAKHGGRLAADAIRPQHDLTKPFTVSGARATADDIDTSRGRAWVTVFDGEPAILPDGKSIGWRTDQVHSEWMLLDDPRIEPIDGE